MENKRLSWLDENAVKAAAKAINEGKIGVGDTDTIPGLFAACTAQGVARLNAIKERSDKPYLMILGSQDGLFSFIKQPLKFQIEKLMENFWPGPLTIILPAQEDIPAYLQSKDGGIAIRVPKHEKMRELALLCGGLLSTSANFTGKPAPETLDQVEPGIADMAAFILYDPDYTGSDTPSTIIDATGKQLRLVRQGAISLDELEAVAGVPFIR
jgi:L-threonylcarbamoyladenylate synthase